MMRYVLALAAITTAATAAAAQQDAPRADRQQTSEAQAQALRLCVRMGVLPDTPAMAACLAADSRAERVNIADRAQYGTR